MKKNILYIEPFSGASGDMFLSALCTLSDGHDLISQLPDKLHLHDGKIEINQLDKNGIVCQHVKVIDLSEKKNPSAPTDHQPHDHSHHHDHSHDHSHDHHHHDHHHHDDHSHDHHHSHRTLTDILKIIDKGHISAGAKQIARDIFEIIGRSESSIHQVPLETIHFHEVSGVDSILDIVGCAVLLDTLKIEKTFCDSICTGFGSVKTQHGMLPVPAPATFDIIQDMPFEKGPEAGEKLTPTGAAIIKYLDPTFLIPPLRRIQTAYGPGEKDFHQPNVLRLSLVEEATMSKEENLMIVECNLDDVRAEYLGQDFQEQLLSKGAVDFHFTNTQMKKGRPGLKLTAMVPAASLDTMCDFILEQTSTIGVRYYAVQRKILARRQIEISTPYGTVHVKETTTPQGLTRQKIEYDSIKALAEQHDMSLPQMERKLYDAISTLAVRPE